MAKRVLRIIARLNVGGPARHVTWVCSGLSDYGWENTLVHGKVEDDEDDLSPNLTNIGYSTILLESMKRTISPLADIKALFEILVLIRSLRPEILHTHTSKAGFLGRFAALLYRLLFPWQAPIKIIHTFHGHTFHGYFGTWKGWLFLKIEQFLAKFGSDVIITISPAQQNEILNSYHVGGREQHRLIPLGIGTSFLEKLDPNNIRDEFEIPSDVNVVGIVGRIAPIKDHELFLQAVEQFNHSSSSKTVFLVIGGGNETILERVEKIAEDMQLPNVYFAGNRECLGQVYGALDYLVLTSKNEGTPVSILEAFAARIPVCSTAVGGVVDLLGENEERGLLVRERTAEEISKKWNEMVTQSPGTRVEAAFNFVQKNYSVKRLLTDLDALYTELLT